MFENVQPLAYNEGVLLGQASDSGGIAKRRAKVVKNPLMLLLQGGPVYIKASLPLEQFHHFLLSNDDLKIERDKSGLIIIHPPMTLNSGYQEGEAFFALKGWSKTNHLGRAYSPSTAFDLPDGSTHKADGAWIGISKLNRLSKAESERIAPIVPDFIMEVRSQSDRIAVLKKKMAEVWMANGVALGWLIDPKEEKTWVYRKDGSVEEVANFESVLHGEDVLPGFEFNLQELKI